jgi:hypothetical protein
MEGKGRDMSEDGTPSGRLSLRKIDLLLAGALPPEEEAGLRRRIASDPAARAYLERQEGLRSAHSLADFRAALERRRRRAGLAGLLAGVTDWIAARSGIKASGPRRSRPALAYGGFAAFACLLLGITVWTGRLPGPARDQEAAFQPKGGEDVEFLLKFQGRDYAPGDLVPARAGDTLALTYRSGESLQVQIWYQEDEGTPTPFSGTGGFAVSPATSWTEAPQRILLEGRWTRQRIWILLSDRPLDRKAAADAVGASATPGGPGAGTATGRTPKVLTFRLAPPA